LDTAAGERLLLDVIGRRAFVRSAAHGCAALLAGGPGALLRAAGRAQDELRIVLVTVAEGALSRGVAMGVEEAARTGALMGRGMRMLGADSVAAADRMLREGGAAALVGGWDEASCRALGELADAAGVLFVNTGCAADALRGADCRRAVFHVEASEAMYAAALAGDSAGATEAVLWHPSLERFGAAQVNDRYRARFGGEGMDGGAWAGWMAAKVLWEASLRARSTDTGALRDYLERDGTQFDGHKGWPLSFRPWDHQLRQPLYLVAPAAEGGTRVAGEVPSRPAEGGPSSRELLDALGTDASASVCRMM
jgi:ABC-type branched-subunit amino acid transport system substrate-binding protein